MPVTFALATDLDNPEIVNVIKMILIMIRTEDAITGYDMTSKSNDTQENMNNNDPPYDIHRYEIILKIYALKPFSCLIEC